MRAWLASTCIKLATKLGLTLVLEDEEATARAVRLGGGFLAGAALPRALVAGFRRPDVRTADFLRLTLLAILDSPLAQE